MAEISLTRARKIIRKTLEKGREEGFKPLSVVVLDTGGHVKAFEREDGASPGRFGIAHGKAYGAIMLGIAGTAQMLRITFHQAWERGTPQKSEVPAYDNFTRSSLPVGEPLKSLESSLRAVGRSRG